MQGVKFVCWEQDGAWLGYLQDYPDDWTQGETLEDLKEHLKDLYSAIRNGQISGIEEVPVPDWQKEELARRKANLRKNPGSGVSWDETKRRIRRRDDP